jgi:glycosyltransferase involved in cell wall biosynthesis
LREALGLPADRPIGLFVGVFDERKRIEWLMKSWIRERGFGSGARLLAIGPTSRADYGPGLRQRIAELAGANPDLALVRDFSPEIDQFYRAADFFVFPTANEGMPNALLEAMSCGLPCVATRVSGCIDLVADGKTGVLFDVDDTAGLASAIARTQGEAGMEMGAAARRFVREGYDIEGVAASYEALYDQLTVPRRRATEAGRVREPGDAA